MCAVKRLLLWLLLLTVSNSSCAAGQYGLPGQLTLQVIEEDGKLVENADVVGWFGASYRGNTDSQGLYAIKGTALNLHFAVSKLGYYKTDGEYEFSIRGNSDESRKQGRWLPWNPTYKVVLRRKINPVGMYWKKVESWHQGEGVPADGKPVGYDLMKGDWVAPYGKGEKADFVFTMQGEFISFSNRKVSTVLTFSNEGDGIQEFSKKAEKAGYLGTSAFTSPYIAPKDGYLDTFSYKRVVSENGDIGLKRDNTKIYFFRIRTEKDKDGKIIRALYGKIHGDISTDFLDFKLGGDVGVYFLYYLNPDGTRNMEHDPGKLIDLKAGK
jgi:hypothetical protein